MWPFRVIAGQKNKLMIQVNYKGKEIQLTSEEISAMVLLKMRETAEAYLGSSVQDAVITVPAYFNDSQRQATLDAGKIAGLNVLRIINEPTAAGIAYGFEKKAFGASARNVLIFDLGGGSCDVSLLNINNNTYDVKATYGDTHLGGKDFDDRMLEHFVRKFKTQHKKDISGCSKALSRLRTSCESAKRILTYTTRATVEVYSLYEGANFRATISRAQFELLNMDLFQKCMGLVQKCLVIAEMDKYSVDEIVLVGGSTRIPMVQYLLKDLFNGKDLYKGFDPDEAVAYGAAVQAAILSGEYNKKVQDLVLLDVTPFTLFIEPEEGPANVFIHRKTTIPTKNKQVYTLCKENNKNSTSLKINVYEMGDKYITSVDNLLGEFELTRFSAENSDISNSFPVCYEVDANGIFYVTVEDMHTGNKDSVRVSDDVRRLSQAEIDRLIRKAELYKLEDEKLQKKVEARNSFENYSYEIRNKINNGGKATLTEKMDIMDAFNHSMEWLDKLADLEHIQNMWNTLQNICGPDFTMVYQLGGSGSVTGAAYPDMGADPSMGAAYPDTTLTYQLGGPGPDMSSVPNMDAAYPDITTMYQSGGANPAMGAAYPGTDDAQPETDEFEEIFECCCS
ncbi:heat shock cognate 70 kDa protein-like isoform X2 [Papaver somniferum]|nr:heat shock cognate 70 kDa protein-like isoform X2 [Papaver somniferum]